MLERSDFLVYLNLETQESRKRGGGYSINKQRLNLLKCDTERKTDTLLNGPGKRDLLFV